MNLNLMASVVEKKGKFFVAAADIEEMKAGKAENSYEELWATLAENNLELVQKSTVMYVIQKAK